MIGTEQLEKARNYFSQRPYERLFRQVKKKYESIGRIGGEVRLSSLSDEEKEALSGLLVRDLYRQKSVTVKLTDLNEKLMATRFSIDLLTLLVALFAEEIKPKAVRKQEEEALWDSFVTFLQSYAKHPTILEWLTCARNGQDASYRMLKERFEELKEDLQKNQNQWRTYLHTSSLTEIIDVINGLNHLPIFNESGLRKGTPLPTFAAILTGDAHFFDRDHFSGRLLYYGILFINRNQRRECEKELRKQYELVGLGLDDLSSQVLIVGVDNKEEYSYALTLRMLRKMILRSKSKQKDSGWLQAALSTKKVFISENPSICSMILDQLNDRRQAVTIPPIICSSGQPSHAAIELCDFLVEQDVHLYYSGDFDVRGLTIAQALYERYYDNWHPWGMTSKAIVWWQNNNDKPILVDKQSKGYGLLFSNEELKQLGNMKISWDSDLIKTLVTMNKPIKIFQEMLAPLLWELFIYKSGVKKHKENLPIGKPFMAQTDV